MPDTKIILDDATHFDAAEKYLRQIEPDILIINFAKGISKQPATITEGEIRKIVETNAASVISWMNAAIRLLSTGAKIGWISSLTALIPDEKWAVYASTNAAINHFIECIRPSAEKRGISIIICYLGCLRTDFHHTAGTNIPTSAVLPDTIVREMSDAIETGQKFWVTRGDQEVNRSSSKAGLNIKQ